MPRNNDFFAGILKGLYDGGVGNPTVQRARQNDDVASQYMRMEMDKKAADAGLKPVTDTVGPDHPIWDNVRSALFGPKTLATAYKSDPNFQHYYQSPTGEVSMGKTPASPSVQEIPAHEGMSLLHQQLPKSTVGNVSWDTATPQDQAMAKAIYSGNVDVKTLGFRERTKYNILANEYANANSLPPYQSYLTGVHEKTAKDFSTGKQGQNVNSLNTAIGHVDSAMKAYQALDNLPVELVNKPINYIKEHVNDPNIVALDAALNALGGELATTFKGSAGTDQEAQRWANVLKSSLTPSQAYGALTSIDDLLTSRQKALEFQRSQGMGQEPGKGEIMSPKATQTRKDLNNSPLKKGGSGKVRVHNPLTNETFELDPTDVKGLAEATKEGFSKL